MLTSFFRKSKPINYLLVGVVASFFYINNNFFKFFTLETIGESFFFLFLYLFLMVLVNFIVHRNKVTEQNTYTLFLFVVFTCMFPEIYTDYQVLGASLFILLALRRIMSMQSGKAIKPKIFDASLWSCCAFLCVPQSGLFLLLVWVSIYFYQPKVISNWAIPLVSVFCVYILATTVSLFFTNQLYQVPIQEILPRFDFVNFYNWQTLSGISVLILSFLLSLAMLFKNMQKSVRNFRVNVYLLLTATLICLGMVVFSATNHIAEILFPIIPISILGGNYLEQPRKRWKNEVLLWSLTLGSFAIYFSSFLL